MQINIPTTVNPQHEINKREIQKITQKQQTTKQDDENNGNSIYPYVSLSICDNLIYSTVYLQSCIETLAEDMVYQDITLKNIDENNKEKYEDIIEFWENNQDEIYKQVVDYCSYGFGASEIALDPQTNEIRLYHIQADTLHIEKEITYNEETGENETYYFAIQQLNRANKTKLKLSRLIYPEKYNNLNECFWLGGGRKSSYYDYPMWISCFNHVSASVSLDMLDADKLANGNLITGILTIIRPPGETGNDVEDTLEEKMQNAGNRLFTLELTSLSPDIPLDVKYIQISESNYDYLKQIAEKSDIKILACFKMPKARLLIDDVTESMNSNKTNTLYKIYSKEVNNRQRPLENLIRNFNNKYFDINNKVQIETPVFVDDKEVETNTTINLFNTALITLGQAVDKIKSIHPDLIDIDIDVNNPIYQERYYNGNPLGLTTEKTEEDRILDIGDYIDTSQINSILSGKSNNK